MKKKELLGFLGRARKAGFLSGAAPVTDPGTGVTHYAYTEGDLVYKDTVTGILDAFGAEEVRLSGQVVWVHAYLDTMIGDFRTDEWVVRAVAFEAEAFGRLDRRQSGPWVSGSYASGSWRMEASTIGNYRGFSGTLVLSYEGMPVLRRHYHGGVIT